MQESDGRRRLAFVAVVVVLAALGIYLTMLGGGDGELSAGPRQSAPAQEPRESAQAQPAQQVATTPPATEFDVYSYLPLSRDELAAAADLARRFTGAYGTYGHQDPLGRVARVKAFTTVEFGEELTRALTAPALVDHDVAEQVVSDGSAKVTAIRDMSAEMVVFLVDSLQKITATTGAKDLSEEYAVTVIKVGADWRVYDMQPAEAGQEGDTSP